MRIALAAVVVSLVLPAAASACAPVKNPYPGTRYDGADLSKITATGTGCKTARRVARKAHRKALLVTPDEQGIRRFTWKGWRVRGDLKPAKDRYRAVKGDAVVRWRF